MKRRGQAAMEFLMTYGWAILVVLAAIGALAYFGVLSPDRFLPSKCVANPPFSCGEFKADSDLDNNGIADDPQLSFSIQASAGVDLINTGIEISCDGFTTSAFFDKDGTWEDADPADPIASWTNGQEGQFQLVTADLVLAGCGADTDDDGVADGDLISGDRIKADYRLTYTRSGESVDHTTTGSIQSRVEG